MRLLHLLALLALLAATAPARAGELVDLKIVLAIDASSSIDAADWTLQMRGYAAAFRDVRVQEAIRSGPTRQIGVAVLVWSDAVKPRWESDWFLLAGLQDAESFADFMEGLERHGASGETGMGAGLDAAIKMLERSRFTAPRQTVDVSGDGRETAPRDAGIVGMPAARAQAIAKGITVNGLAIVYDDPALATWYRDNVMTYPDGFVVVARDAFDFADAVVGKLVREIEWPKRLTER